MPYYMGDFYSNRLRGDYYRGDPGFLSFLGGLGKAALGAIPGVGPIISSVVSGIGHSAPKALPAAAGAAIARPGAIVKATSAIKGAVLKHPVLSGAGAAGIIGATAGIAGTKLAEHLGRKRGGRRRMRVTNVKALRRALRRAQGFEKLAMRTIHLVHPRKHVRFGGFKKRKKARVC